VIKNRKTSPEDNKKWVQYSIAQIGLPEGITFDTAPYGKNQKIRMVESSKDGEKRPLVLVKGTKKDSLISLTDGCELMVLPKEKKTKKTVVADAHIETSLLEQLVMSITNDETTTWEQWYKVGQAIFNEGGSEELFQKWSFKSSKHDDREASKQWRSYKSGAGDTKLTAGSLYYWSQQSNPEEYERIILTYGDRRDYNYQKVEFEKTHFKLMNPPCYVRIYEGQVQYVKDGDLSLMYQNKYCKGQDDIDISFITKWKSDRHIRTYERVVFKPKQFVPNTEYNIFTDFPCNAVEGDISVVKDLMWILSGESEEIQTYIENYFAHMIQKPYEKPGVCIVFSTQKQGAGKDTPLDFVGSILGDEYFFNTEDAENNVFGRFTSHLQKCIMLKMEEVEFETNKKNESALLSLITASKRSYEGKGKEAIVLDDYKRIVMTTNKSVPINVPESDRRCVLINSSEKRVGDREYWDRVYKELAKKETKQAFYYYLLTKDISAFNIRNRPTTNFYQEVKTSLRPYHSVYFQNHIETNDDISSFTAKARDLFNRMNAGSKFAVSETRFGRDMKAYDNVITKIRFPSGNTYTYEADKMREFLKEKGWWVDL
jgi:hypothetical protein